ncbi:MAG: hypothetical protein M3417_09475 [Actinomycetota bacterium]|nr:hypothetical protein [Actinomycetota bacterium]
MSEDEDRRAPAEKVVAGALIDRTGVGRPLSERTLQRQRTVESYLRGDAIPRYMQRAAEIERGQREHRRRLAAEHHRLRECCGADAERFARAWEARAQTWDFTALNDLIRQHNEWYPVERDLPMDPRTGDYVLVHGRSYKRELVGPQWVLAQFPPHA